MTHFIALKHSLDHASNANQGLVSSLELDQTSDLDSDCSICGIYLNVEISKTLNFTYTLLVPKLLTEPIFKNEEDFTSLIFYLKKSRAPPTFTV
ncbi:hypothetical protein [Polaribacter cellanae]|uniref:Uncharacterized protein n=1 Tax=Polaribacter cellanae TaxID=2818493 RepID=A0A975CPW3_9FLAO|nr:hypothetical protein [Polaribacter cellanae]QTE23558.1 hypothetical protein J3359_04545 [Polaribacter cellanae]